MSISGTGFEVILSGAMATFIAQGFKVVWELVAKRQLNFKLFVETGGMPSSHSASMTAVAMSVGMIEGFSSVTFAVALAICLVVMYDAAGVRLAAGRMAGVLNKMSREFYAHDSSHIPERLKELLGHTPIQVYAGSILGALIGYYYHLWLLPPST